MKTCDLGDSVCKETLEWARALEERAFYAGWHARGKPFKLFYGMRDAWLEYRRAHE